MSSSANIYLHPQYPQSVVLFLWNIVMRLACGMLKENTLLLLRHQTYPLIRQWAITGTAWVCTHYSGCCSISWTFWPAINQYCFMWSESSLLNRKLWLWDSNPISMSTCRKIATQELGCLSQCVRTHIVFMRQCDLRFFLYWCAEGNGRCKPLCERSTKIRRCSTNAF